MITFTGILRDFQDNRHVGVLKVHSIFTCFHPVISEIKPEPLNEKPKEFLPSLPALQRCVARVLILD